MGDEQMYGVWSMFELLSSEFRAILRDLDVDLRGNLRECDNNLFKIIYQLVDTRIFPIWLIVVLESLAH